MRAKQTKGETIETTISMGETDKKTKRQPFGQTDRQSATYIDGWTDREQHRMIDKQTESNRR